MNYPNRLLVSPAWVSDRINEDTVILLDVRAGQNLATYTATHLPNARPFSLPHCKSAAAGSPDCLDEEALVQQLSDLGVHPRQTVVLYDQDLSHNATLGFWALEYIGQERVYLLEGGVAAWQAAGLPMVQGMAQWQAAPYPRNVRHARTHAADFPFADSHHLLDVRGVQEYYAAHIEGATHCCWTELVEDLHTLTLLPPEALTAKLSALHLFPDQEITTYCRSGARGSFVYFVLRLMGWERVRLYDGSMNDWLLRENPVMVG